MMGHGPGQLIILLADMNFLIDDQSCDLLTGVAELQSGFLLIDRKAPTAKLRGDAFQKPFIVLRKRAVTR